MQKLHLVGFTTDQKGLILSARRGARAGSFHLPIDEPLAEAVEELRARQDEEEAEAEFEELQEAATTRAPRVESALPVREIQARLRQGRTVQDVAKAAGVEPGWVERFADPVFAERAQVITRVRGAALRRPRLGPSSHPIGDAVRHNLSERGVVLSPEEFASAWNTRQLVDGRWAVRFGYHHRGKDHVLRFDLYETTGAVVAVDRSSSQLGYVAPASPPSTPAQQRPQPAKPSGDPRPSAKRATVTTGFRPEGAATKAVSRPAKERERASMAMRKAAAKGSAEAERAATRKTKEKQETAARGKRAAKVAEVRKLRERAAAERAKAGAGRAKTAAAKRAAAVKARRKTAKLAAAQAKRAEAALVVAEKAEAAERAAKKKAAATKAAAKKAAAKKASPTKVRASKATATRARATKVPASPAAPVTAGTTAPVLAPRPSAQVRPLLAPLEAQVPVVVRGERSEPVRPDAARALFRAGLVESVADQAEGAANGSAPPGGVAPPSVLGRPRRTRPLRAT